MDVDELLTELSRGMDRFREELEVACEASLQSGTSGVLVLWRGTRYKIVAPAAGIPFGEVHQRVLQE